MYSCSLLFYKGDDLVGVLRENGRDMSFEYDPGWQGGAISPLLPLGKIASGPAIRAWFRNMLPEERRRRAFETLTKLSLDRIGQFLSWFGEDLPGDLSTRPASAPFETKELTFAEICLQTLHDTVEERLKKLGRILSEAVDAYRKSL